jgi:hypothetical protein
MRKSILLLAICLCISNYVFPQDLIILKKGSEIKSKVLELTQSEIKYKRFDNLDGPIISVSKADVQMIKYQNGTNDVINTNQPKQENEASEVPSRLNNKPFRIGFYADPLGFIQIGPSVGTEITIINHLIIDAHVRFTPMGLLLKTLFNDDGLGGKPDKMSGMDVGGGIKALFPSRIGGLYVGVLSEYGQLTMLFTDGSPDRERKDTFIACMASIGYKFRFPGGFYVNTGANLGAHIGLTHKWHYVDSSTWRTGDNSVDPFGMLEVALGIEF